MTLLMSLNCFSNTIEIFEQYISLPSKYALDVTTSLDVSRMIYRTGISALNQKTDNMAIIKIGKVEDYVKETPYEKIEELGTVVKRSHKFNELIFKDSTFDTAGKKYYYRFYYDESIYISYMVLNVDDIDYQLKGNLNQKGHSN